MLLAGDLGGTKVNLMLFSEEAGPRAPLAEQTYPSAAFPSFTAVVETFLRESGGRPARAAFGVAGPVVNGRAEVTNLGWTVDGEGLARDLALHSVRLLNDLEAIAASVPHLHPADLYVINPGIAVAGGAIGVIAPGTGLGEAFLTWDGHRYRPHPSEGGHGDFAPNGQMEQDLLAFMRDGLGHEHVSYERVCSGLGIPNLYQFFAAGDGDEPPELAAQLAGADDPTPLLITTALATDDPWHICRRVLSLFLDILAAEAGNLAVRVLATGGVYIGGGIPPRILSRLDRERFTAVFRAKGRMAGLLARVPVAVITNPKAGMLGAAYEALAL